MSKSQESVITILNDKLTLANKHTGHLSKKIHRQRLQLRKMRQYIKELEAKVLGASEKSSLIQTTTKADLRQQLAH